MCMILNATNFDCLESMIAAIPAMYGQSFGCNSSLMRFSRPFVLKIKWILLLEYECDMGRPHGTQSRLLTVPALPRWAKLVRPCGTRNAN